MSNRANRRSSRQREGRRIWVASKPHPDLRPEQIARIFATAGLEQARREADAHAAHETRRRSDAIGRPPAAMEVSGV